MSSTEQEPCLKRPKMDPPSEEISSPILDHTDSTMEVPIEKFSILTAMMDRVPDVFVDNVLADMEFPDWFTFKCVSHRCQDIVLSNLKRLKKPEEIAIRILWANNTKTLTFGHQKEALHGEEENTTFIVFPSSDSPMNTDPEDSWREGSLLFTRKQIRAFNRFSGPIREVTEVRNSSGDEVDVVVFLLKKFLPRMLVNGICAKQLEKEDFVMLSEILKTYVSGNMHITIVCDYFTDIDTDLGLYTTEAFGTVRSGKRYLVLEDIMPILVNKRLASISLRGLHISVAIPKSFFELSSLKNIVKIHLEGSTEDEDEDQEFLSTKFDDELLLTALPQLKELRIGKSNVTTAGLNTFLKQYIAGSREFIWISLILCHPDESIEEDELWTELVDGISWPDHYEPLISKNEAGYNERNLGMFFPGFDYSVAFFTNKSKPWNEVFFD